MVCRELHFSKHAMAVWEADKASLQGTPMELADLTGSRIWDSALLLATFLDVYYPAESDGIEGKTVGEIGAGCGVAGLLCAKSGARHTVFLDRCDRALAQVARSAEENGIPSEKVSLKQFDWQNPEDPKGWGLPCVACGFDLLLLSDVIYADSQDKVGGWGTLVEALMRLSHEHTEVYMAIVMRDETVERFFEAASIDWELTKMDLDFDLFENWPIHRQDSAVSCRLTPLGCVYYARDDGQLQLYRLRRRPDTKRRNGWNVHADVSGREDFLVVAHP